MTIPENKYLGKLCKRGHDWNGTGKSLRFKSDRCCIICQKIKNINLAKTPKRKLWLEKYKSTEEYKERRREQRKRKGYKRSDKEKERDRIWEKKARDELRDLYIRNQLRKRGIYAENITPELMQQLIRLKRIEIKLKRQIMENNKCQIPL